MAPRKTTADDVLAFDFGQLETEQLNSLSAKLQGIVSDRKEQDKQDFINEVREKAIAKGLDIGEILGQLNKSKGKIRTPTKPKYEIVYEDGSRVTWSGKGRRKNEFTVWQAENPDSSLDELLIDKTE
jgi:DNA-binding protein H-NS